MGVAMDVALELIFLQPLIPEETEIHQILLVIEENKNMFINNNT